jgi:hypothetical protein
MNGGWRKRRTRLHLSPSRGLFKLDVHRPCGSGGGAAAHWCPFLAHLGISIYLVTFCVNGIKRICF